MDKIKKYKQILKKELEYQVSIPFANAEDLSSRLVINKEETEFVVLKMGWVNHIFKHGLVFHFVIKEDKIWLYKNHTDIDIDIGTRLAQQGIPKSDIVLGFVSKMERTVEGYAMA